MIKYGIVAGIISIVVSVAALAAFKTNSIAIPIGAGCTAGAILVYWIARFRKRVLSKKERLIVITIYSLIVAIIMLLPILGGKTPNTPGALTLLIHMLAYPGFFSLVFSEKNILAQMEKNA